jgi:hypothetical protein
VNLVRKMYLFIYYKWLLFSGVFVGSVLRSIPFLFLLHRVFPPVNSYRATHCRNMRLGVLKSEEKGRRWRMGKDGNLCFSRCCPEHPK